MSFSWINYIRTSKNSVKQVVVLTFVYLPPLLPSQLLESWSVNLWSEYRHLTRNHEILFPPFRHLCSLHAFWIWAGSGRKLSHLQGRPCPYHFRANCPKVFSSLTGASFSCSGDISAAPGASDKGSSDPRASSPQHWDEQPLIISLPFLKFPAQWFKMMFFIFCWLNESTEPYSHHFLISWV